MNSIKGIVDYNSYFVLHYVVLANKIIFVVFFNNEERQTLIR